LLNLLTSLQHVVMHDALMHWWNLWTSGEDFTDLPLADTHVINMSLDHDGVFQSLLRQVLAIERPEFESRNHSLTRDVIRLRRELAYEQVHCVLLHSLVILRVSVATYSSCVSLYFLYLELYISTFVFVCVCPCDWTFIKVLPDVRSVLFVGIFL